MQLIAFDSHKHYTLSSVEPEGGGEPREAKIIVHGELLVSHGQALRLSHVKLPRREWLTREWLETPKGGDRRTEFKYPLYDE